MARCVLQVREVDDIGSGIARQPTAAIVGAGLMGRWHARSASRAGARLVGVADCDLGAARRLASGFRHCGAFAAPEELLARIKPEVVHICTPAETHRRLAESCIDAGAHLIIEKPLTPAAADTDDLLRRAAARGVLVCPVHQYLFQEGVLRAADLLERIGKPLDVQAIFCSAGGADLPASALDGVAADILPHPLSLIARLLDPSLSPDAFSTSRVAAGELHVSWERRGAVFSVRISMSGRPTCATLRIIGAQGTLHLDLFHGYVFLESGRVSRLHKAARPFGLGATLLGAAAANMARRVITWEPAYPGLQRLIHAFYRAAQTAAPPPVSPEEVRAVARARDRILSAITIH